MDEEEEEGRGEVEMWSEGMGGEVKRRVGRSLAWMRIRRRLLCSALSDTGQVPGQFRPEIQKSNNTQSQQQIVLRPRYILTTTTS